MDAVTFIKERNRMCDFYKSDGCYNDDEQCPAFECKCENFIGSAADGFKIVDIVDKWSSEHPRKTMAQDFFEKHPFAPVDDEGLPEVCANAAGYKEHGYCSGHTCFECWNRPLEG